MGAGTVERRLAAIALNQTLAYSEYGTKVEGLKCRARDDGQVSDFLQTIHVSLRSDRFAVYFVGEDGGWTEYQLWRIQPQLVLQAQEVINGIPTFRTSNIDDVQQYLQSQPDQRVA